MKARLNKGGFTLVELLAVIAILTIISLIAVPILIDVINSSKARTEVQNIELYGRAVDNALSAYFVKYPLKENVTIEELEEENLINYKGKKVDCEVSQIIDKNIFLSNCKVDNKEIDYVYGTSALELEEASGSNVDEINNGDKYSYKVNSREKYTFYVLSKNDDDTINLIMDRNICEDGTTKDISNESACKYQWYSSDTNSKGPVTAMTALYNATKDWTNVPDMKIDYEDEGNERTYGYGKIGIGDNGIYITEKNQQINTSSEATIPYDNDKKLKARLPKYGEIIGENDECSNPETCPTWLLDNLNNDGYWTLSSHSLSGNYACILINPANQVASSIVNSENGIRPVITVPVSFFKKN